MKMKGLPASIVIAIMIVIVLVPANATADPPVLNFTDPTEPNNSYVSRNWTESNITIDEPHLDTFRFNWNSTNYTFYDDSLVLAMNFNNNSAIGENSNYAVDISKYGNNGTIYGANQTTNGKFGSALEFDGTDDYVDCGNDTSLQFGTGNFSVELWVKYTTTLSRCFISTINVDWTKGWFIETASGGKIDFFTFEDPAEAIVQSGQLYNDDIWHHVTGVRKLNKVYLYVDGVQVANASESAPVNVSNAGNLSIAYTEGDDTYTNGTIDSVRIYNRSLSADEIYYHYQSELRKYNSTQWRFYTNTTGLTDGTYTYYGWANDTAGNEGQTETRTLTVDTTPPVVNTVTLNTTTPNTGDAILVTVDATDNVAVTNVTADGVELTYQSGNIWDGTIIAIVGTHSVNVSAVDATGNTGWNNSTSYTATTPDTTPPASITDLQNTTYQETYINWTWTDPLDADFSKVMVYLDGTLKENVTKGIRFYNATGLTHNTEYEISTHTVDSAGNINDTWKNDTAKTAVSPEPETPYLTYGWVFYKNGTACDNPTVNITNSNTSKQWQAETNVDYSYYQLILDTTNISAGNVLEFNAASPNGNQTNITEHAVTQEEVNAGGFFDFNLTLESTGDLPPSLVTYTITNTTISPNGDGIMDDTEIDVEFSEYVSAAIKIENVSGVVQSLYTSNNVKDPNPKTWDGTDDGGNVVADGIYYVNITGTNTSTGLSVINNTECIVVDTTPPVITDNSPTGAGAPVSTNITATFNESMNPDTLNNETVTVEHNGTAVNGNITYDASSKTVTFDPAGDLNYSETYNVTITTDVQDIAGNNMSSNVTWNFTTSSRVIEAIISIGNASGNVTIPITIEDGTNVGAVDIMLTYNASVVNVTNVTDGDMDITMANLEHVHEGWVRIGAFQGDNPGLDGSIILANVTFRSNSTNGTSPLNLSVITLKDATNDTNQIPYIVQNGTYTAVLNGDVNGDGVVDIADAMYLAKHVIGKSGFEEIIVGAADVNDDGVVDIADAMYLAKHVIGELGFEELM